jgi:hypothetical protein
MVKFFFNAALLISVFASGILSVPLPFSGSDFDLEPRQICAGPGCQNRSPKGTDDSSLTSNA